MVRVLPDVPAIDKVFDYLVPDAVRDQVRVGDVVRVELHGRRVGGWVVEVGVEPPAGVALRPLAKRSGLGPTADLLELSEWAAWRWAGRRASLLRTASPHRVVSSLPSPARLPGLAATGPLTAAALKGPRSVLRLPPAADPGNVALAAAALGPALVLCPTESLVSRVAARLASAGVVVARHPGGWAAGAAGTTVVGTRAAAWAPVGGLAAVVVIDEHDEAHQQEQAPTWHARDVAAERAERAGVPCVVTSPCPTLEALEWGRLHAPERPRERAGWPAVVVADRREEEPGRAGMFSPTLVRLLREGGRSLCVLNRTGRSRLLACAGCGELATCDRCGSSVDQPAEALRCRRCGQERPAVCLVCGASRFKNLRAGVARVREELEALLGEPVVEMTAGWDGPLPQERVLVGTEAVLQRVGAADLVAFLDLDQELLAPRFRAVEQAMALVARAARVVAASGPRAGGRAAGRLLLQTRLPGHEVVEAAVHGDPARVSAAEAATRLALGLPPCTAMAEVSGAAAGDLVAMLASDPRVEAAEVPQGRWLLRAPDHRSLCDALAAAGRPPGRVRVAVDPLRV